MKTILSLNQAGTLSKTLKAQGKTIVLVGGCFDILHLGHIIFLEKSKARGDVLVILLESDQTISKLKGQGRPINSQNHRARVLAALKSVDFVIQLPPMTADKAYDKLIFKIKPDVLATTKGDKGIFHKKRQAKMTGAKLLQVTNIIAEKSTTAIQKIILKDL